MPEPTEGELVGDPGESLGLANRIRAELLWSYATFRQRSVRQWVRGYPDLGISELDHVADRMQIGERGNNTHAYYRHVLGPRALRGRRLVFVGCGNGLELLLGAHFGADECVGVEFLSYERSWRQVSDYAARHFPRTRLAFHVVDSLDPQEIEATIPRLDFDVLLSAAVLEHVRDLNAFVRSASRLLRSRGTFFSVWGPMWWSYGGDHIAPELGLDQGFIHLMLDAAEYDEWYRGHPRNQATIAAGKATWKDLDLYSFLRYVEYDAILRKHLEIRWRNWIWAPEAIEYERQFPGQMDQLVAKHGLAPYDLYLKSAAVVGTVRT